LETGSTDNKDATASTQRHSAKGALSIKKAKGAQNAKTLKNKSVAVKAGSGKTKIETHPRAKPMVKIAAKPHAHKAVTQAGKAMNKKTNAHPNQTHAAK
jgi:hypothetical protein